MTSHVLWLDVISHFAFPFCMSTWTRACGNSCHCKGGRGGIKGFAFHVHVIQHCKHVIIILAFCSCTWYNDSLHGTTGFPRKRFWWRVILIVTSHGLLQELNCCYIKYVPCSINSGADCFLCVSARGVLFFCLDLYYCLASYTHYIHV